MSLVGRRTVLDRLRGDADAVAMRVVETLRRRGCLADTRDDRDRERESQDRTDRRQLRGRQKNSVGRISGSGRIRATQASEAGSRQIVASSCTSAPRANRSGAKMLTSKVSLRPSRTSSDTIFPVAGDIIRPWPLKPFAKTKPRESGMFAKHRVVVGRHLVKTGPSLNVTKPGKRW